MRNARLIETITAGEFALEIVESSEIKRLLIHDQITTAEADAAQRFYASWYNSGLYGYGASWHEGGSSNGQPTARFESICGHRSLSWVSYIAAINSIPRPCRGEVQSVVLWDTQPRNIRALRTGLQHLVKHYEHHTTNCVDKHPRNTHRSNGARTTSGHHPMAEPITIFPKGFSAAAVVQGKPVEKKSTGPSDVEKKNG